MHQRQFSCATLTLGTVGAVCDYIGRKPAMIMTTLGQVIIMPSLLRLPDSVNYYITDSSSIHPY